VNPELLVLRAIESGDDTKQEDLEEFEVTTILDTLEEKGYIQIAWIEGHSPEAVRLLDKGRVYLKHLEEGSVVVEPKPVVTPQQPAKEQTAEIPPQTKNSSGRKVTWEERKQFFKTAVLIVMEKKKADGNYLFENNSQWMAVYRFAVDSEIMYKADDLRKPKDTSAPQYAAFANFAKELQLDENPPTRMPFTKNAIDSINSKPNYARFNTTHPWSHEGITDPRSLELFIELEDVYLALKEEYENLVSQAERAIG
jgi:DNA-binding PadR family transcriptional regulator